jgi:hypothetical protein
MQSAVSLEGSDSLSSSPMAHSPTHPPRIPLPHTYLLTRATRQHAGGGDAAPPRQKNKRPLSPAPGEAPRDASPHAVPDADGDVAVAGCDGDVDGKERVGGGGEGMLQGGDAKGDAKLGVAEGEKKEVVVEEKEGEEEEEGRRRKKRVLDLSSEGDDDEDVWMTSSM